MMIVLLTQEILSTSFLNGEKKSTDPAEQSWIDSVRGETPALASWGKKEMKGKKIHNPHICLSAYFATAPPQQLTHALSSFVSQTVPFVPPPPPILMPLFSALFPPPSLSLTGGHLLSCSFIRQTGPSTSTVVRGVKRKRKKKEAETEGGRAAADEHSACF